MYRRRPGRKNSPSSLSRHFLKVMVRLSVIRIWRQRSASEISTAGLVGFRFLLDSGLHVADDTVTEAPRPAARAMCQECRPRPSSLVTAEGRSMGGPGQLGLLASVDAACHGAH